MSENFYFVGVLSGKMPVKFTELKKVASQVVSEHGACRVITNLVKYQDSKHLHFHVLSGQPIKKK